MYDIPHAFALETEKKRKIYSKSVQLHSAIKYPVATSYCTLAVYYLDTLLDVLLSSYWRHTVSMHQQINLQIINKKQNQFYVYHIPKSNKRKRIKLIMTLTVVMRALRRQFK